MASSQVADELLEFWSNFVGAIESTENKEVEYRFQPYIERLVVCLCMLCKLDANEVRTHVAAGYHASEVTFQDTETLFVNFRFIYWHAQKSAISHFATCFLKNLTLRCNCFRSKSQLLVRRS